MGDEFNIKRVKVQEIFDSLLDKSCRVKSEQLSVWKAKWIWYPGQLAAAMHGHSVRKSVKRCCEVGYPGLWPHPVTFLYARRTVTIKRPLKIRWAGPSGRTVLLFDTSFDYAGLEHYVENYTCITQREKLLPAGRIELEVIVDYADGLACFMLEGGPLSTDEKWEVSLDRKKWVLAECEPAISTPERTPDNPPMTVVTLARPSILQAKGVQKKGSFYIFKKGGKLLVDFGYNTIGRVGWKWSVGGRGVIYVSVGESPEEALDRRSANAEQNSIPPVRQDESPPQAMLPERAFRYAFLKANSAAKISSLKTESALWPVEYCGDFESSDEVLNKIWKAGAATIHATMQDYFFLDAVKRDALPWAPGDYLSSIAGSDLVFFDRNVVRQHLLATSLPENPQPLDLGLGNAGMTLPLAIYHDYMVNGDASLWEDFVPGEQHPECAAFYHRPYGKSLCHSFAGGVAVTVLSQGLLGIQPEAPGYRKVLIAPRLCGLEWVRGKVPTPHGLIGLELNAKGHGKVKLPSGVEAQIATPEGKLIARFKGAGKFNFLISLHRHEGGVA